MEYILRFTLLTLLCVPDATLLDIQPLLTDKEARTKALSYVGDEHIISFWLHEFEKYSPALRAEAISPILNKTGLFITCANLGASLRPAGSLGAAGTATGVTGWAGLTGIAGVATGTATWACLAGTTGTVTDAATLGSLIEPPAALEVTGTTGLGSNVAML